MNRSQAIRKVFDLAIKSEEFSLLKATFDFQPSCVKNLKYRPGDDFLTFDHGESYQFALQCSEELVLALEFAMTMIDEHVRVAVCISDVRDSNSYELDATLGDELLSTLDEGCGEISLLKFTVATNNFNHALDSINGQLSRKFVRPTAIYVRAEEAKYQNVALHIATYLRIIFRNVPITGPS